MTSELKKRIEEREKQKALEDFEKINRCSIFISEEIMDVYLPKTKTKSWYIENCVGTNKIPIKAVNGHNGGTPFYTKDKKIMRSGETTWSGLKIQYC